MTPFHLRITSSARFSTMASASNPGHNCMVDAMERWPASNSAFGSGWNRPPVNSATCFSSASFDP